MGDQKDNVLVQKKETESNLIELETAELETATESLSPPAFQLVSNSENEGKEEDNTEKKGDELNEFQFSLTPPPEESKNKSSKIITSKAGRGISEPFRMPVSERNKQQPEKARNLDKPSFRLEK